MASASTSTMPSQSCVLSTHRAHVVIITIHLLPAARVGTPADALRTSPKENVYKMPSVYAGLRVGTLRLF